MYKWSFVGVNPRNVNYMSEKIAKKSVIVDNIERYYRCHFRFLLPIQVLYSITYDVQVVFGFGQNLLTQKQIF